MIVIEGELKELEYLVLRVGDFGVVRFLGLNVMFCFLDYIKLVFLEGFLLLVVLELFVVFGVFLDYVEGFFIIEFLECYVKIIMGI